MSQAKVPIRAASPGHDQAPRPSRQRPGPASSTTAPPGAQRATTAAGASRTTSPWQAHWSGASPRSSCPTTNAVTSAPGRSRGAKRSPVGACGAIRSTRKIRQWDRSTSHATRYQRPDHITRCCGSTRNGRPGSSSAPPDVRPGPPLPAWSKVSTSRWRTAVPTASSTRASTGGAARSQALSIDVTRTASTRCRSRFGMTWRTVASARAAASPRPATVEGAVCSATATAMACSSSNSRGGIFAPASSRYAPPGPLPARTG